jgi:hypothetical protein
MLPLKRLTLVSGLIVALLIVVSIVFYVRSWYTEGFATMSSPTMAARNTFAGNQNEYFGKKFNRAVFLNDGLVSLLPDVGKMFAMTDVAASLNGPVDISKYFDKDPFPGIAANNQVCASVLEPKLLPPRNTTGVDGCGWWYADDNNAQSVGARGTQLGPYNTDDLSASLPGGRWVWDLVEAQKLEDVKRCRRVQSCDVADLVPGQCAFCPPLNTGIPVDSYGNSRYPDDPALNCGSAAISNPANCPRPEAPNTPDGAPPQQVALLCDPNPATGKLSNDCLIALAKGAGCKESGVIINILAGDSKGYYSQPGQNNTKFKMAKQVLMEDTSIASNDEYVGYGSCLRSEALGYYNTLVKLSRTASTKKARNAAGFLALGLDFDECEMPDSQMGPFFLHCQQRAASEAGCQPDGSDYPTDTNKGDYDAMSWKGVVEYFRDLHSKMSSNDMTTQVRSTKQCLGVDVVQPEADCGDVNGLSIYVYKWEYESDIGQGGVAGGKISKATYYGRMINSTYPNINNNGPYTPFGIGTDRIYLRFRAKLISPKAITTRFYLMTDDGVSVIQGPPMQGGKNILRKWWDQGPTSYETPPIVVTPTQPQEITTDWYNNYGGYVIVHQLWQDGAYATIPPNMIQQVQPTGYPIARWDFYEGIIQDRCRVLDSEVIGSIPITTMGGLKCAQFQGRSYIRILNPMATTAFKTITMTIYINSNAAPWPRPWEFNNSALGSYNAGEGNWCEDSIFGCFSPNNSLGAGFYCQQQCEGPSIWTGSGTMDVGKWYHYAWVIDDDMKGFSIYINGVKLQSYKSPSFTMLMNKIYKNCYIFNSVEYWNKDVGVGWFRIFDYTMTQTDVIADSQNAWFNKTQFKPSPGTGWDRVSKAHA